MQQLLSKGTQISTECLDFNYLFFFNENFVFILNYAASMVTHFSGTDELIGLLCLKACFFYYYCYCIHDGSDFAPATFLSLNLTN